MTCVLEMNIEFISTLCFEVIRKNGSLSHTSTNSRVLKLTKGKPAPENGFLATMTSEVCLTLLINTVDSSKGRIN